MAGSKHLRSSSPTDESRKRHKHKHKHHHKHHHHRDKTKKHEKEEERDIVISVPPPPLVDYDDMEEGEIVDEAAANNVESDVESGEFKGAAAAVDAHDDNNNAGADAHVGSSNDSENKKKGDDDLKSLGRDGRKKSGKHRHYDDDDVDEEELDGVANGDVGKRSSRSHKRSKSPTKDKNKHKVRHEGDAKGGSLDLLKVDDVENGDRRKSSSHKVKEKESRHRHRRSSRSPSRSNYDLERGRSVSQDRVRGRERSQSVLREEHSRLRRHHEDGDGSYENGKVYSEFHDERDNRRSSDYGLDVDIGKDRGRERSSSRYRSGAKDEDSDLYDREREERIYRDKKREKDRELSRERSQRDHDRDRDWDRERERNKLRDREGEKDTDRDRKADRGPSRDRADRGRRRDDSIASYRDRVGERESEYNYKDNRDRQLEMDKGNDRNSTQDSVRDKIREAEGDRNRSYIKYDERDERDVYSYQDRDRRRGRDEDEHRRDRHRRYDSAKDRGSKEDLQREIEDKQKRDDDNREDDSSMLDLEIEEQEEDDIDKIKEESRRRREAILQKYKAQELQQPSLFQSPEVKDQQKEQPSQNVASTNIVHKEIDTEINGRDSAAADTEFHLGKSPGRNGTIDVQGSAGAGGLGEGTPKSERSNDMFCDDIFGDSPAGVRKTDKGDSLLVERSGLHDNWDDPEGYYSFRFGEVLDCRYEVTAAHGKGVFSTVVRAKDLKAGPGDPEEVAIKIIRNNETMLKAGIEELVILKKLVGADPDDRRHCVRYLSHFKYRNHLCIVFESLHMNLRELLKKFGRNIGLKLTAVRAYAKQLFIALKHLKNCGVLHCDIKPDNMLVNDAKNVLKLCDFGNAMFAGKNEITPYLVSRFYRAPEIILGLPYDHPLDIWSVGCCLYELFAGKVLFPGATNNDMLRLHMELKGPFPKKMLRKGGFIIKHFDQDFNFLAKEEDPVTKKEIMRLLVNIKPKDMSAIVKGSPGEDPKMLTNFKDLLEKIFVLDPDKRLTVSQALNHPFITGK